MVKVFDFKVKNGQVEQVGPGWHKESKRHSDVAIEGHRRRGAYHPPAEQGPSKERVDKLFASVAKEEKARKERQGKRAKEEASFNTATHRPELIKKSELTSLEFYNAHRMAGDAHASKYVDHYLKERQKILNYGGASAVDRKAVAFYEDLLVGKNYHYWWHSTDMSELNRILWLLRRLKKGISREQEKVLFGAYITRLPYHRRFPLNYGIEIKKIKGRFG